MTNTPSNSAEKRYVTKGGDTFLCRRVFGKQYYRCGACKRGLLYSWDKACKVCKATVFK